MKMKLRELLLPQAKSKIKAGDGLSEGKYKFFTCSPIQNKFYDTATYDCPSLIFGTGGNASVHYCEEPFSTSTDCLVMYGVADANLELIYQYLHTNLHILQAGFKGAGLQHISKDYILDIEIDLPNEEMQTNITKQFRQIDDMICYRNQQLLKYDELVKSRFIEMFGDPVLNPMGWQVSEFSNYITFLTSGSRGWAKYFSNDGEYFITIKNVKNCRITLDDVQHIIPPDNAEAKRTKVKEGDLLISITADLGRTGIVTKEIAEYGAYINQHLTCIRLEQDKLRPLYVAYYLESDAGKDQFQSKNQNGVKAGLNFNAINSLKLLVPPVEEQDAFLTFVEQTDKLKFEVKQGLEKLEILKKSLMQQYFG